MLYLSLVLVTALLALANVAVHRPFGWRLLFFACGATFTVGCAGMVFLPPVALAFLGLSAVMLPWIAFSAWAWASGFFRRPSSSWKAAAEPPPGPPRPWLFLPLSAAVAVVAFAVPGWYAVTEHRKAERLRAEFAYESLEGRVPLPPRGIPLPEKDLRRLEQLEDGVDSVGRWRTVTLHRLHDATVSSFVNSPGFGVTRMFRLSEVELKRELRSDDPLPQPDPPSAAPRWPADLAWLSRPGENADFAFHDESVLDFLHPAGFGLVEGGRVAGFQSHRFSKVPPRVRRIDLIGLLRHAEPAAYVSANLPRMDELRDAPTRPLDEFEAAGVERLRKGEDLILATGDELTRMVGAIRSVKQCVACHGGRRGDLLGAFSYTLGSSP